jgi:hypothetical protein
MVAAAVALYRAAMPSATAAEIKQALLGDVDPLPAFTGKSVTGGRLTVSHLTGVVAESVSYAFTSMNAPAGVVSPAIGVTGPTAAGNYDVVLGLGMEDGGEIWAVSNKAVTLDGVTVTTDDAGDAVFPLGSLPGLDAAGLSPTMELGDGRYVLTVQTYRDGSPVGRMYAAPLLVGSAVPTPGTPGATIPGAEPPDGSTPGGSPPPGTGTGPTIPGGATAPRAPSPSDGGSTPGGSGTSPGTGTGPGTTPGTTPGTSPGSGSDDSDAAEDTPSLPPGTTTPGGSTPGGSGGGTSPGSDSAPDTSTPDTSAPDTPTPGTSTPDAPAPGTTTYPSVGVFRITSLSPDVVGVGGGTVVTITGLALPADPTVRIGGTTTATIVASSTTRLSFRVPARVAGVYDVSVFAPDGRSTVLSNALTYAEEVGGPDPGDGTGSAPDGSTPGGSTPGGTTPGGTSPGGSSPGGTTPDGSTPDDGSTPGTAPVVRTGPAGERLVRSAKFDALRSIWSLDCSSSCTGVAI